MTYDMGSKTKGEGEVMGVGSKIWSVSLMSGLGVVIALSLMLAMELPPSAEATGDANEESCPIATESSPGFRPFSANCRAFELVTPPYKEGGVVIHEPAAISSDGSHVIIGSAAEFSGAGNYWLDESRNDDATVYELVRGQDGWSSTALTPPSSESSSSGFPHSKFPHSTFMAVSAESFSTTLWSAATSAELRYNEAIFLRTGVGESEFHLIGPGVPPTLNGEPIEKSDEDLFFVGASHDLRHVIFGIQSFEELEMDEHHGHTNIWPGDTTNKGGQSLYEYVYASAPDAEPTLVGVRNEGPLDGQPLNEGAELISKCGTELGSGRQGSAYNAVSSSGEAIFFTASKCQGGPEANELYVRVGGRRTIAISEPAVPAGECTGTEPCVDAATQSAVFEGASENGECVFFLSEQPLVNGAPAEGMKLYEERLKGMNPGETPTIAEVIDLSNQNAKGTDPEVQGVARVAEDGERVYFVAKAALAGENGEKQSPESGADNLYVFEPGSTQEGGHRTAFVGTLLRPGEEASLEVEESAEESTVVQRADEAGRRAKEEAVDGGVREAEAEEIESEVFSEEYSRLQGAFGPMGTREEDKSLWQQQDVRPVQATPQNGEVVVFLSSAHLIEHEADESTVPQLFEYDAATESLAHVSPGEDGDIRTFDDAPQIPRQTFDIDRPTEPETGLTISETGSKIFFTSRAQLASQARPGATNVYVYENGSVYLVSNGDDAAVYQDHSPAVTLFGVDPSGQDAFFTTVDQLVPQDGETQMALYDARENGGFPAPSLESGCSGEICRGASGAGPQSPAPGSASQSGGDNLAPTVATTSSREARLIKAQELANALKACKALHRRRRRAVCEAHARRAYAARRRAVARQTWRARHRATRGGHR